jgi:nicotinate phosphoribosyltransferase
MATGDLNEYKILELVAAGTPIDAFGVGTELATSADAPTLGAVYKLVELESNGVRRYTAKFSADKHTMPASKQVFRYAGRDEVACAWEEPSGAATPLLKPVIRDGELAGPLPDATAARNHATRSLAQLPKACRSLFPIEEPYLVTYTPELQKLLDHARQGHAGAMV